MAFYKDMKHKTRQEKRVEAAARGGFEDEGAGYRKGGAQKGRAARSAQGRTPLSAALTEEQYAALDRLRRQK